MIVLLVHVHVKPESVDGFKAASTANARQSVQEPGIARFDFIQQIDDPTRFVLIEAYRSRHGRRTQGDAALRGLARRGRRHDGLAAAGREAHEPWPADEGW